jgi:hypothetical protein
MMPSRESCIDMRYESTDATSTNVSTVLAHGKPHELKFSKCLGPGVGSPKTLKTPSVLMDGLCDLRYEDVPVMHPPVPTVVQKRLISGSCSRICGPVHCSWAFQFYGSVSKGHGENPMREAYVLVVVLPWVDDILAFVRHPS